MSENLSATEVVLRLNRYYSVVTGIVTKNRGTLHKFAGDMVMAFWNVMLPDDSAEENAIRTGLELQVSVFSFDFDLEREGQQPVYLGIGCNTGEFAGGNIGGTDRMEYTIIGDNVNLAQRIESLACRWQVLVSTETIAPVKEKCIAIKMSPVVVKGRTQPIDAFSVRGIVLEDGSLFLSIPVFIEGPDSVVKGIGLLTRYKQTTTLPELHLCTTLSLPSDSFLTIRFDLPECSCDLQLQVQISKSLRTSQGATGLPSETILKILSGNTDALEFFKPGSCIMSDKNWDNMNRH
jgi:class 3 adenylate cyclase